MGRHFDAVLKLLAENRLDDAQAELDKIDSEVEELEKDRDLVYEMIEHKRGPKAKLKAGKLRRVPEGERSALIKKQASEIARANSGKASIADIAKAIVASGYDLGTKIPGTVIANVLIKDSDWKRVEKGLFQFVGTVS